MSFSSAFRVALEALFIHKGRSLLTTLGIVIGIAAVLALVSAGTGARLKLDERLASVGKNLIIIRPGGRTVSGTVADYVPLTQEDANVVRQQARPWLVGVAPLQVERRTVTTPFRNWATSVVGTAPDLQIVGNWRLLHGRFIQEADMKKQASVCVLGQTVRRKLFPGQPNPVGLKIRAGQLPLTIAGVLASKGHNPLGADEDDQIFVPLPTLEHRLAGKENLVMILASARSQDLLARAQTEIARILRQQHHITSGHADNFDISSVHEMAQLAVMVTTTMQVLVPIIAAISLLVGGIGIMNIMLVAVTERTREIGIRLAVGATPANVLLQFLLEAVVLSLAGGLVGIVVGIGGAVILADLADWPAVIRPASVLAAVGVAAGVGILFGFYPALKASRMEPIQALHYE